jgi:hypothetical protein
VKIFAWKKITFANGIPESIDNDQASYEEIVTGMNDMKTAKKSGSVVHTKIVREVGTIVRINDVE